MAPEEPLRILVVDDEEAITSLMAAMLAHAGFEVTQAHGGVEALAIARAERPDLVMLDVMMPDLDGRAACHAIRGDPALHDLPVALFSSADERDIDWRGVGANAFLQKPFRIQALPGFVRDVLARAGPDGG